jgi:hypothetical protein
MIESVVAVSVIVLVDGGSGSLDLSLSVDDGSEKRTDCLLLLRLLLKIKKGES